MYGLNIKLISVQLDRSIISRNNQLRIFTMAYPNINNVNKDSFVIEARRMNNINKTLTLNVSKETKTIVFTFERKSFFQNDPMIASTDIKSNEIPKSFDDPMSGEVKTINIYEPILNDFSNDDPFKNRRIVGKLVFKMSVVDPSLPSNANSTQYVGRYHNGQGYSKVNTVCNDENQQSNNLLFD